MLIALALGVAALLAWPRLTGRPRALALIVAAFPCYVALALAASWLDRQTGHLGKVYLFRPVSVWLLLAILLGLAMWRRLTVGRPEARMLVLLPLIGLFLIAARERRFTKQEPPLSAAESAMVDAVRGITRPEEPVLLDPALDGRAGTYRAMRRDTIVHWKFVPTNPADIYRWWSLIEQRRALFAGRCAARPVAARWLVAVPASQPRVARCGRIVWRGEAAALIALPPATP